MTRRTAARPRLSAALAGAAMAASLAAAPAAGAQTGAGPTDWRQHELERPRPPALAPRGEVPSPPPPPDAIVLFDGRDLSAFVTGPADAPTPPRWTVGEGYVEVVPRSGSLRTKESFGDVQLHVEWAAPNPPVNTAQNRGNSGFILMGRYEIQVLDSYERADTYADGQAGSIYGQYPPLVNASRPPGQWQSYDIFFRRPRFGADGALLEPARVTVVHNGILVQNNEVVLGPTASPPPHAYVAHEDELPLTIQDHSQPVRFRNLWVRRIAERPAPAAGYAPAAVALTAEQLAGTAGTFFRAPPAGAPQRPAGAAGPSAVPAYTITVEGGEVLVRAGRSPRAARAIVVAPDRLWLTGRAAELVLTRDARGVVTAVTEAGSSAPPATRRE